MNTKVTIALFIVGILMFGVAFNFLVNEPTWCPYFSQCTESKDGNEATITYDDGSVTEITKLVDERLTSDLIEDQDGFESETDFGDFNVTFYNYDRDGNQHSRSAVVTYYIYADSQAHFRVSIWDTDDGSRFLAVFKSLDADRVDAISTNEASFVFRHGDESKGLLAFSDLDSLDGVHPDGETTGMYVTLGWNLELVIE